ncbi:hypothetical protein ACLFMI_20765 [Pseudonocardia nantongensis]|uniref:hypothetical protein n=1 Tax=Pseudonocardia nantongensis TaxID=1181885 RepID=UPI00397C8DB9
MNATHEVPATEAAATGAPATIPVVDVPAPRTPTEVAGPQAPATPPTATAVEMCRCGHERDAHEHFRAGTDCGVCGIACSRFHARTGRGARSRLRGVGRVLRRP